MHFPNHCHDCCCCWLGEDMQNLWKSTKYYKWKIHSNRIQLHRVLELWAVTTAWRRVYRSSCKLLVAEIHFYSFIYICRFVLALLSYWLWVEYSFLLPQAFFKRGKIMKKMANKSFKKSKKNSDLKNKLNALLTLYTLDCYDVKTTALYNLSCLHWIQFKQAVTMHMCIHILMCKNDHG